MNSLYIRVRGQVHGPYEIKQMQAMIRQGRISRFHEVSEDGSQWRPASEVPELFPPQPISEPRPNPESPLSDPSAPSVGPDPESVWRVAKNNQELPPMRYAEMRNMAQQGLLSREDQVWTTGMPQWGTAGQVPGLFDGVSMGAPGVGMPIGRGMGSGMEHAFGRFMEMMQSGGRGLADGAQMLVQCKSCGGNARTTDAICPHCGHWVYGTQPKRRLIYVIAGFFFGWFGIHNFYAGRMIPAVVQLGLTLLTFLVVGIMGASNSFVSFPTFLLVAGVLFKLGIPLCLVSLSQLGTESFYRVPVGSTTGMAILLFLVVLCWTAVSAWSFLEILLVRRDGDGHPFGD